MSSLVELMTSLPSPSAGTACVVAPPPVLAAATVRAASSRPDRATLRVGNSRSRQKVRTHRRPPPLAAGSGCLLREPARDAFAGQARDPGRCAVRTAADPAFPSPVLRRRWPELAPFGRKKVRQMKVRRQQNPGEEPPAWRPAHGAAGGQGNAHPGDKPHRQFLKFIRMGLP